MLFEMTHFTDLCNWFLQDEPVEVMAMSGGLFNQSVSVRYRRGAMASIVMCGSGTPGYPKELYEVMGHGAIVAVDHLVEVRTAGIAGAPTRLTYPMLNDRHPAFGAEGGIAGWQAKKHVACAEAARRPDVAVHRRTRQRSRASPGAFRGAGPPRRPGGVRCG